LSKISNCSRKEFKPTIPTRRKKHSANPTKPEPVHASPVKEMAASFDEKLKQRLSGKSNTPDSKVSATVPILCDFVAPVTHF
jgi:hypothetical protein